MYNVTGFVTFRTKFLITIAQGTTLLNHILHHATLPSQTPKFVEIYLHVQTSNEEALAFYKRNDFEIVGTREGYYKRIEPPDAHILKRVLIKD